MQLDIPTLTFAGAVGAFASGMFLLMNWWQDRSASPALWWGVANCGLGVGTALLAFHDSLALYVWHLLAPPILDMCAVVTWVAARTFNRSSVRPVAVAIATALWVGIESILRVRGADSWATGFGLAISTLLYLAGAFEFWRTRDEALRGRWAMIALLGLYTVALCLASVEFHLSDSTEKNAGWIGMVHFAGLIYALGSSMFLLSMLRDRSEQQHRTAAMTDVLTGLPNRRAFEDQARRLYSRSLRLKTPLSVIAFDLDRFKQINDTFGHPVGDEVLVAFGEVLTRFVRSVDAIGRLGGEEFVVLLPDCRGPDALTVASRIRVAFQNHSRSVAGRDVLATVSAGVATLNPDGVTSIPQLIEQADQALYRAKRSGRNCVSSTQDAQGAAEGAATLRVA